MRTFTARWTTPALLLLAVFGASRVGHGDDFQPTGRWALLDDWGWPIEMAIFDVAAADGKFDVRLIDAAPNFREGKVKDFQCHGRRVSFTISSRPAPERVFEGNLAGEGPYDGQVLGTFQNRPARLKTTSADRLAKFQPPPYQAQIDAAEEMIGKQARTEKFLEIVRDYPGPITNWYFRQVLVDAEAANLTEEQVNEVLRVWFTSAEPYGPAFLAQARLWVLRSLRGQRKFAPISLDVAEQGRICLGELATDNGRSSLLRFLSEAAELCGRGDAAAAAQAQADAIDDRLDADYRAKVPPFKVDSYPGRKPSDDNRVVLLELFTGALCQPCVAADVAFEALNSTFGTSELILLQYHLPIPGADPMTNPSTLARQKYYAFRGVPTAFFNGEECPTGGGSMAFAEAKYNEYRQRIEPQLAKRSSADIDLSVSRTSDGFEIRAMAAIASTKRPPTTTGAEPPNTPSPLRLRLVLTEESIRYDGGNGVRFNRHVVRAFPGGIEGTPLRDGRAAVRLAIRRSDVVHELREYMHAISARLALACPSPHPPLELKHMALVAFIQDDATRKVIHAVSVPVPGE